MMRPRDASSRHRLVAPTMPHRVNPLAGTGAESQAGVIHREEGASHA
ncbi:hypothetical protein [Microbacterium sp. LWH12-1.2]